MISCIIPAYNEQDRITAVLNVVKQSPLIDEIVVVNDGSTDGTKDIVKKVGGIKAVDLPKNIGKGGAMKAGIDSANGELILFLDADLKGLTTKHVEDLIRPVLEGIVDMTLSYRDNSGEPFFKIDIFSGERCLKKEALRNVKGLDDAGYAAEALINKYVLDHGLKWMSVRCTGLRFVQKEEKASHPILGTIGLYRMYWNISRKVPGIIRMWWWMGRGQQRPVTPQTKRK